MCARVRATSQVRKHVTALRHRRAKQNLLSPPPPPLRSKMYLHTFSHIVFPIFALLFVYTRDRGVFCFGLSRAFKSVACTLCAYRVADRRAFTCKITVIILHLSDAENPLHFWNGPFGHTTLGGGPVRLEPDQGGREPGQSGHGYRSKHSILVNNGPVSAVGRHDLLGNPGQLP